MPFDFEWPVPVPHQQQAGTAPRWRPATSQTQTQSNGCDGRISIVHFQKWFPRPPSSPAFHKAGVSYLYLLWTSQARRRDADTKWCVCAGRGEERGQQLKKKARMIQSLQIPDLRRRMDIRVETWQSAAALTGSGIDNDQWLGQWDVWVQAGELIKWHQK